MARIVLFIGIWLAAQPGVAQPNGPWLPCPCGGACADYTNGQTHDTLRWLGLTGTRSLTVLRTTVTNKEVQFVLGRITKGAADSLHAVFRAMTEDLVFQLGPPDNTAEHNFEELPLNSTEPYTFTLGRMAWSVATFRTVVVELLAVQTVNSQHVVVRLIDKSARLPRNRARP